MFINYLQFSIYEEVHKKNKVGASVVNQAECNLIQSHTVMNTILFQGGGRDYESSRLYQVRLILYANSKYLNKTVENVH